MGNVQGLRHALGVIDIGPGAAGALARGRSVGRIQLQGDADHIIALALEQRGGDGGIDAATHGGNDAAPGLEDSGSHDRSYRTGRLPSQELRLLTARTQVIQHGKLVQPGGDLQGRRG